MEVDVLVRPDGEVPRSATAVVLRPDEIDVGNLTGCGEKYKFKALGGTLIENALASGGQIEGLTAVVEFLRAVKG